MREKKQLFLESYFDFDSIFPMEYFEMYLQESASGFWLIYYANDQGETVYGPFSEDELMERLSLAPFYFEEIVFVYHLVENQDQELQKLGVRLLRRLL
jgi:hypothetical protein